MEWGLGTNGTKNRVKDLRRERDGHVPGVYRLAQHTDIEMFLFGRCAKIP